MIDTGVGDDFFLLGGDSIISIQFRNFQELMSKSINTILNNFPHISFSWALQTIFNFL